MTLLFCQVWLLSAAESTDTKKPAAIVAAVTGSGRPMILIPGLGCGGNVWDSTVAHFKGTYQCHVITLAGFAGQPSIGQPFLEQVRDALGKYIRDNQLERPLIVGHSLGAILAFSLAATIPEQVGPIIAVDGVPFFPALGNANATVESLEPVANTMRGIYSAQPREQFVLGYRAFLTTMITDAKNLEKVAEAGGKSDPAAVGQAFYEIMTTDLRTKVQAIQTPVLLLGATASIANADQKQRAEENYRLQVATIPSHKVVFAPKARHFIQLDEPDFFFHEVESFLKEIPR